MIVTLIGYRGCGKSSVGPLLAERLGCACIDSDDVVENRSRKSIADIFATEGEAGFRRLETKALHDLLQQRALVIAAGGGAILAEVNRLRMKKAGSVVWLQASAATLAKRIGGDETSEDRRPSLTGKSIQDEVAAVLEERRPMYEDAATLTVDAEHDAPATIAEKIFSQLSPDPTGNDA